MEDQSLSSSITVQRKLYGDENMARTGSILALAFALLLLFSITMARALAQGPVFQFMANGEGAGANWSDSGVFGMSHCDPRRNPTKSHDVHVLQYLELLPLRRA